MAIYSVNPNKITTRQLLSDYYCDNPKYKLIELDKWAFIMPCLSTHPDIKDTYHYYAWRPGNHRGVDFLGRTGNSIFACGAGTVTGTTTSGLYGNSITMRHGMNSGYYIYSRYAHLDGFKANIKIGAKVIKGQQIGYMGSTGDSLSPHLHFEILLRGWFVPEWKMFQVDPLPFLPRSEVLARLVEDATHGRRFEYV